MYANYGGPGEYQDYEDYNQPFLQPPPQTTPQLTPVGSGFAPVPPPQQVPQAPMPVGQQAPSPNPIGSVSYDGNPQAYVQQLIATLGLRGKQADPSALNQIVQALKARGLNVELDPRTDGLHKGIMLNGQFIKLLDGNDNWTWLPGGNADSGGNNGNGIALDPSYLAPFNQQFDINALGGARVGGQPGQGQIPNFEAPAPFQAPTGESILNDPSYQFRRDETLGGLASTRAAQGLYNSGGTVYDLGKLASNFASQEYGNMFNRDFNLWNANWNNALSKYNAQAGSSNEVYNRANQQYQLARDIFYANQQNPYSKLFNVAQLGANTAANAG